MAAHAEATPRAGALLREPVAVAAVQTLPPVTRQQLLQLWQDTLQLVQGGSSLRQPAVQACDAGVMTDARTPAS